MEEFKLSKIKLIVGLGNIGKEFNSTRHNVGFTFLNHFLPEEKFNEEIKFKAVVGQIMIAGKKIILAKPNTYMNNSGESVLSISNFYKIEPQNILVVHDDLDIALGNYKIQFATGPKIHNGILSIENILSTEDFWRLRIGIDNRTPEEKQNIAGADYVLGRLKPEENETINILSKKIIEEISY